jgi:membrane protein DedA with SNARE-associated domain
MTVDPLDVRVAWLAAFVACLALFLSGTYLIMAWVAENRRGLIISAVMCAVCVILTIHLIRKYRLVKHRHKTGM